MKKNNLGLNQKGFTITETLLSVTLLTLITGSIAATMQLTQVTFNQSLSAVEKNGNLKRAVTVIARDLSESKKQNDPQGAGCDANNPNYVCIKSNPTILSFKVPESTSQGTTSYKTIKYTFDPNVQTIARAEISSQGTAGTSQIVGRNVTAVSFTWSNNAVKITMSSANGFALTSQAYLRNS